MPKEFPQIRLHGNKDAAVLHAKRGMLELFKTQSWQELAGVPITKRTVEVNDYTTITVQVAKEQTFIDITSNPPPGFVPPPVEEKPEEEFGKCPPGFIVRKLAQGETFNTDSLDQTKYTGTTDIDVGFDGYIIAYNASKKEWALASFRDELGEFEGAYAGGWWHLDTKAKELSGSYKTCDLITMGGGGGGLGASSFVTTATSPNTDQLVFHKIAFTKDFYMGGKEYRVGGNTHCLGACIIKDPTNHQDYFHVLKVAISQGDPAGNLTSGGYQIWRQPVGGGEDEGLGSIAPSNNPSPFYNPTTPPTTMQVPRGLAYVDEDGYAYIVRAYGATHPELEVVGSSVDGQQLLKIDLRNGDFEILLDSPEALLRGHKYFRRETSGSLQHHNPDGGGSPDPWSGSTTWNVSLNSPVPRLVGVFGGLDKLYTYQMSYDSNSTGSASAHLAPEGTYESPNSSPPPATFTRWFQVGTHRHRINESSVRKMIVYEGTDKEIDSLIIEEAFVDYDVKQDDASHASILAYESGGPIEGAAVGRHLTRWILSHHPKIKDSWEYLERLAEWDDIGKTGTITYKYVAWGKTVVSQSVPIPSINDYFMDTDANRPSFPYDIAFEQEFDFAKPRTGWYANGGRVSKWRYKTTTFDRQTGQPTSSPWWLQWDVFDNLPDDIDSATFLRDLNTGGAAWGETYGSVSSSLSLLSTGVGSTGSVCGYGRSSAWSPGSAGASHLEKGSANEFIISQTSAVPFSSNLKLYMPNTIAVHRPVEGEIAPYLAMSRKMYMSSMPLDARKSLAVDGAKAVLRLWYLVYLASHDPAGEDGVRDLEYGMVTGPTTWGRERWLFWRKELGSAKDGYLSDEWALESNFLTEKQLNALVRFDPDVPGAEKHMHFEIAVL
jgi:hypothetical protein